MKLFVGLGNPGQKYERNRHNIGFMAVEEIARVHGFAPWRSRFRGEVSEGLIEGQKCLLLKPHTYMNLSGEAVRVAAQFYKIPLGDVIVLHDEIDLAAGKLKVKAGGGNAGHNGLKSISQHMGNDYIRVRMGVGRPTNKAEVANFVLKDFAKADQPWLEEMLSSTARHAGVLTGGDISRFASLVGQDLAALDVAPDMEPGKEASAQAAGQKAPKAASATGGKSPTDKIKSKDKSEASALGAALKNWLKKGDEPDGL